ncbi:unnamed protein product [Protopolystoma xenopodis]|uniref:Uncharacterized protein n=1 Tax=Protopolystoma xenopodis TaxID=117903 RepID=A0A3S5FCW8_9PLAT|nr:unnamed protein product [Protopolystoma xenopodis]
MSSISDGVRHFARNGGGCLLDGVNLNVLLKPIGCSTTGVTFPIHLFSPSSLRLASVSLAHQLKTTRLLGLRHRLHLATVLPNFQKGDGRWQTGLRADQIT